MKKIGLILNPVAGVGGPAGLKGSDGAEIQEMAKKLGIQSAAPRRATVVLEKLATEKDKFVLLTAPGEMGADIAKAAGYEPQVIGEIEAGKTTPEDTIRIARQMRDEGIDLLLFAGGDGTATYDPVTNTLTLDNYSYNTGGMYLYEYIEKYGAIGGTNWDTDLLMEEQADGTWKSVEAYEIADGVEFKVRQGKSWDNNYGIEFNGANMTLADLGVEAGTYFIVFDPATGVISVVAG